MFVSIVNRCIIHTIRCFLRLHKHNIHGGAAASLHLQQDIEIQPRETVYSYIRWYCHSWETNSPSRLIYDDFLDDLAPVVYHRYFDPKSFIFQSKWLTMYISSIYMNNIIIPQFNEKFLRSFIIVLFNQRYLYVYNTSLLCHLDYWKIIISSYNYKTVIISSQKYYITITCDCND